MSNPNYQFQVGQNVRVTTRFNEPSWHGRSAEVVERYTRAARHYYKLRNCNYEFATHELEKADIMEFKKGDRVIATGTSKGGGHGGPGLVTGPSTSWEGCWCVNMDGGGERVFPPEQLQPEATEFKERAQTLFEQMQGNPAQRKQLRNGCMEAATKLDETAMRQWKEWLLAGKWPSSTDAFKSLNNDIKLSDNEVRWCVIGLALTFYWNEMFPSITSKEPTPTQFKVGDRIKLRRDMSRGGLENMRDKQGVIRRKSNHREHRAWIVDVYRDGQKIDATFYNEDMELIVEPELELEVPTPSKHKFKFQPGDRVVYNGAICQSMKGMTGVITRVKNANYTYVDFNDGPKNWSCNETSLDLVPTKFKIGDRVRLGDTPDPSYGGTVTACDYTYVTVDWDRGVKHCKHQIEDDPEGPIKPVSLLDAPITATFSVDFDDGEGDVIALCTFEGGGKLYEYLCPKRWNPKGGTKCYVDTPTGRNKIVTIRSVTTLDKQKYPGTLKRIKGKINPARKRKGALRGMKVKLMICDDLVDCTKLPDMSDLEQRIIDSRIAYTDSAHQAKLYGQSIHEVPERFTTKPSQEDTMIQITRPTLVNGYDAKDMSDDAIIGVIDKAVQEVDRLVEQNKRVKSKALVKKIAEQQKGIDELRAILDARVVGDEPAA